MPKLRLNTTSINVNELYSIKVNDKANPNILHTRDTFILTLGDENHWRGLK